MADLKVRPTVRRFENYAMQPRHSKNAFTFVELLVVIAIIGILVALLLPAVQSAREAARRMQCSNNLKQIGLALHNYETMIGEYPPGAFWGGNVPTPHKGSILVHILPFIEQQNLYDAFDFEATSTDGQTFPNDPTKPIGATVVSVYDCPSDTHAKVIENEPHAGSGIPAGKVALHNYAASAGPSAVISNGACPCAEYASFNAFATAPFSDGKDFAGAFTRMSVSLKASHFKDGLSNTIFFGEVRPMCSWHNDSGWATSNNGNGYSHTIIPINYDTCSRESTGDGCGRYCNWSTETGFRSAHPGGAFFLLGDGSVQFLSESIDYQTYQYLGDRHDGEVISVQF